MHNTSLSHPYPDPYDLWAMPFGIAIRRRFYAGSFVGKLAAAVVASGDWLAPSWMRALTAATSRTHPVTISLRILTETYGRPVAADEAAIHLDALTACAARRGSDGEWSWGLGFAWMSKNGLYSADTPFVTHTPYAMEALLKLEECERAQGIFDATWDFLERLHTMHQDERSLALSYAPIVEPRIVINANAYACLAYALHAAHGRGDNSARARQKAVRLAQWVVDQQEACGAWWYYADTAPGNFIDGFHSCFVIKNLRKAASLLPDLQPVVSGACERGAAYMRNAFFDASAGLCRRFVARDMRDPYAWDLYDQAEYLGMLIDGQHLEEAQALCERVVSRFCDNGRWWCRIDALGRRWGPGFMRWGIVPFLYQRRRLQATSSAMGA